MSNQTEKLMEMIRPVVAVMSSEVQNRWIDDPHGLQNTLQQALWQLQFLMTIKLGTGLKTDDDFCQAIADIGGQVSPLAKDIMKKPDFVGSVSQCPVELDLHTATTEEILSGKGKSGTLKKIYAGIARMGGKLLPAETGPQLRRQYPNQPNGELLLMAMEQIEDSDDTFRVFSVGRDDDDPWLSTYYNYPGSVWHSGCRWVFALPRCQPACQ